MDGIDDFFGAQSTAQEKNKKGRDIMINLEINFMDAILGLQKTVSFDRVSICTGCNGSKCKAGSGPTNCGTCGGSGKVFYKQGYMSVVVECTACNGVGNFIRNPCTSCYGKGFSNSNVKENINIPKGVDDNMNLRIQKKV